MSELLNKLRERKEFTEFCTQENMSWFRYFLDEVRHRLYSFQSRVGPFLCESVFKRHDYIETDWNYEGKVCVECRRCGHSVTGYW